MTIETIPEDIQVTARVFAASLGAALYPQISDDVRKGIDFIIFEAVAQILLSERIAAEARGMERAAKIAAKHRALVPNHDPEAQRDDLVAQGYGNAAFNIEAEIRAQT